MICSYCENENNKFTQLCDFCQAPLDTKRPKLKDFLYLDQCELPFSELVMFHTYDLLILLRLVREERSSTYNLMRIIRKASKEVEVDLIKPNYLKTLKIKSFIWGALKGLLIDCKVTKNVT
jgi:predicted amidophosphoribosyltransferase